MKVVYRYVRRKYYDEEHGWVLVLCTPTKKNRWILRALAKWQVGP